MENSGQVNLLDLVICLGVPYEDEVICIVATEITEVVIVFGNISDFNKQISQFFSDSLSVGNAIGKNDSLGLLAFVSFSGAYVSINHRSFVNAESVSDGAEDYAVELSEYTFATPSSLGEELVNGKPNHFESVDGYGLTERISGTLDGQELGSFFVSFPIINAGYLNGVEQLGVAIHRAVSFEKFCEFVVSITDRVRKDLLRDNHIINGVEYLILTQCAVIRSCHYKSPVFIINFSRFCDTFKFAVEQLCVSIAILNSLLESGNDSFDFFLVFLVRNIVLVCGKERVSFSP